MPEAQPALFETRQGSIIGALDVSIGVAHIHKTIIVKKLLGDRLGIILPVGSDVNSPARF